MVPDVPGSTEVPEKLRDIVIQLDHFLKIIQKKWIKKMI